LLLVAKIDLNCPPSCGARFRLRLVATPPLLLGWLVVNPDYLHTGL